MFLVLAVVLPVLLLAILGGRRGPPLSSSPPVPRLAKTGARQLVLLSRPLLRAELLPGDSGGTPSRIGVWPADDPAIPDLLAYWSPDRGNGHQLPDSAILLGSLTGSRPRMLVVPETASLRRGYLVLLSLARHRIVATAVLAP
jgi:hypothetical protein